MKFIFLRLSAAWYYVKIITTGEEVDRE